MGLPGLLREAPAHPRPPPPGRGGGGAPQALPPPGGLHRPPRPGVPAGPGPGGRGLRLPRGPDPPRPPQGAVPPHPLGPGGPPQGGPGGPRGGGGPGGPAGGGAFRAGAFAALLLLLARKPLGEVFLLADLRAEALEEGLVPEVVRQGVEVLAQPPFLLLKRLSPGEFLLRQSVEEALEDLRAFAEGLAGRLSRARSL